MSESETHNFGDLVRQFRVREGFTQEELAKKIGVHRNTVDGWERKGFKPDDDRMIKLINALSLTKEDIIAFLKARYGYVSAELLRRLKLDPTIIDISPPWNVPYSRNLFFTGRVRELSELRDRFTQSNGTARVHAQALTGLGGIGKTQIAVEYAFRYRDEYSAVFWVRAVSRETLIADFGALAHLLDLPSQDAQDQMVIVTAARRWLEKNGEWLLIFDNADEPGLVRDFLPTGGKGDIILTTRVQATGKLAARLPVENMEEKESVELLLRRASMSGKNEPPAGVLDQAKKIVKALDGLPLALDQAGAYIEETECSLLEYWKLYQQDRQYFLDRPGSGPDDYPYTVAKTWVLSFEKVEKANPAAAELLHLCAFLYPDAIPEAIITEGSAYLGPVLGPVVADDLQFYEAIQTLRRYSLIKRDFEKKVLNLHRLVQDVVRNSLEPEMQKQWAERTVLAVNRAFSSGETRQQRQPYLPHAKACLALIDDWQIASAEATQLLCQVGCHYMEIGNYFNAEPPLTRAHQMREQTLGPEHPDTIFCLNKKVELFYYQAKYPEAIDLAAHLLDLRRQTLGLQHPDVAQNLNDLGLLYKIQCDRLRAETFLVQAVEMRERILPPEHLDNAESLNNLASLYTDLKRYDQAERLFQRALDIHEKVLGKTHPMVAYDLLNLAQLYSDQKSYARAEPLINRAYDLRTKALGSRHPEVAECLNSLALLYYEKGYYGPAEGYCSQALDIRRRMLGDKHPAVAQSWNVLGLICHAKGEYAQAEKHYLKALSIRERVWGVRHSNLFLVLTDLLAFYKEQQNHEQGDKYFARALDIRTQMPDCLNPDAIKVLEDYAGWRQSMGEEGENAM